MKKTILLAGLTLVGTLALAGCNTMQGAGQDLHHAGNAIHNATVQSKAEKAITQQLNTD